MADLLKNSRQADAAKRDWVNDQLNTDEALIAQQAQLKA